MNLSSTRIFSFLRCYAISGLLVGFIIFKLVSGLVFDRAPVPEAPHAGYVCHGHRVFLQWRENGLEPPFAVQIIGEGETFKKPGIERTVKRNSIVIPNLKPGTHWRWRVVHKETGTVSRESYFSTVPNLVRYQ